MKHITQIFLWLILLPLLITQSNADQTFSPDKSDGIDLVLSRPNRILIISTRQITHKSSSDAIVSCIKKLQRYYPNCMFDVLELNVLSSSDDMYKEKFAPYLPRISDNKYQVIVPILDRAVDLLAENASHIPHDVMIVGYSDIQALQKLRKAHPNTTGIYEFVKAEPTIKLALKVFPDAKQIVLIGDSYDSGHSPISSLTSANATYAGIPLRVISDDKYNTSQMLDIAAQVPFGDILIFSPWRNFAKDGYPSLEAIGEIMCARAQTPFFVLTSGLIGSGAFGGNLNIGTKNGDYLAEIIRQCVITGDAKGMPFGFVDSRDVFDENLLNKFRLKIPSDIENPLILNHKQTMFEAYGSFITMAIVAFLACISAIGLLWRKRNLESRTKIIYDSLPMYFALSDSKGNLSEVHLESSAGFPQDNLPKNLSDFGEFIFDIFQENIAKIKSRKLAMAHTMFKSPLTGKYYTAMIKVAPADYFGANKYIIAAFDCTEQALNKKRADDMLEQEKIYRTAIQMVAENMNIADITMYMLRASARILSADRMAVYHLKRPEMNVEKVAEHSRVGEGSLFGGGLSPQSSFYEKLAQGETIVFQCESLETSNFPPTFIANFRREEVKSAAMTGVGDSRGLSFIISAEYISSHCKITGAKANLLENIAKIVQLAQQRSEFYEKLRISETQLNLVFAHMQSPILLFNADGSLAFINKAAATLVGRKPEEMKSCELFRRFCKKTPDSRECNVNRVFATKKTIFKTLVSGSSRYRFTASPILDASGKVIKVLESAIDVTEIEKKSAELADALMREQNANALLAKAVAAAEDAAKAKGYFLATMSHELRTPLNSIIGYSELIQDASISESDRIEHSRNINFSATLLLQLINDILDLSKIESDKIEIVKEPVNMKFFVDDIVKMFSLAAAKNGSRICARMRDDIPPLLLDISRLRQIVTNIVGNAVKFTSQGLVTIEVFYSDLLLVIKISDTGMGIAPQFLKKIFEPFEQESANIVKGRSDVKGTGLGLAISQKLANKMGGKIDVESAIDVGSCFTVTLPNVEVSQDAEGVALREEKSYEKIKKADVARDTFVIIVDDVEMNLKVLGSMLKKMGVKHCVARSGAEALELMSHHNPTLILTDLWMPEMTGIELANRVRENKNWDDVKVIAVTADSNVMGGEKFFDGVLLKPITIESVRNIIEGTFKN